MKDESFRVLLFSDPEVINVKLDTLTDHPEPVSTTASIGFAGNITVTGTFMMGDLSSGSLSEPWKIFLGQPGLTFPNSKELNNVPKSSVTSQM